MAVKDSTRLLHLAVTYSVFDPEGATYPTTTSRLNMIHRYIDGLTLRLGRTDPAVEKHTHRAAYSALQELIDDIDHLTEGDIDADTLGFSIFSIKAMNIIDRINRKGLFDGRKIAS